MARVSPSGCLLSLMDNPVGSFVTGISAVTNALAIMSLLLSSSSLLNASCDVDGCFKRYKHVDHYSNCTYQREGFYQTRVSFKPS